jgi:multidrug efflux system outer membrane protein
MTHRNPRPARQRCAGLALAALASLGGCDLAPNYLPPHYILPASYQGRPPFAIARPLDTLPRGPWWQQLHNPLLDRLEQQLTEQNPDLAAMAEEYTQARDLAAEARAGLLPQIGLSGMLSDNKQSRHRVFRSPTSTAPNYGQSNEIAAAASWTPDFWSQIRNATRMQKRLAQVSAAALATARLSLQAELADDYIMLRGLDADDAVYHSSIAAYAQAVHITQQRLQGRIASALDVARAEGQLASTQALENSVVSSRAVMQHAIAVLVGSDPISFSIPATEDLQLNVPDVPVGVPSALLQRRPDIAGAERQMAAANAGIGVSIAAFYPNITLSVTGGFQDTGLNLFNLPNSLWTIGANAALPIFEGGLRHAELQKSWSQYAQARDSYRATVLFAFQEVEDGLALTTSLQAQSQDQARAVTDAQKAETISMQLYIGGLIDYLNVVVAQETELTAQIAQVGVEASRLQASVNLIAALGGGWSTTDLPAEDRILPLEETDYEHQPQPQLDANAAPSPH